MAPSTPTFINALAAGTARSPADELAHGLLQPMASVSPKFLYDRLGSALFTAITELPEYYPTRTEAGILAARSADIAASLHRHLVPGLTMVDLGAGDGAKAARLFGALQPSRYVAVDISEDYLRQALQALQRQHPQVRMHGVAADFSAGLSLPPSLVAEPALVFYPGSSIGNFAPPHALRFLREAHALSRGGALLIGADMMKSADVLHAAYDDALGVTAAFNLNLLQHANALLGSDFDVRQWQHVAVVNTAAHRVEMHLQARLPVAVRWPGAERRFDGGERIHTEHSHKWSVDGFRTLLEQAGWGEVQHWTDAQGWFGVFLAQAR